MRRPAPKRVTCFVWRRKANARDLWGMPTLDADWSPRHVSIDRDWCPVDKWIHKFVEDAAKT